MRGTSGRDAKICAPAVEVDRQRARPGSAGAHLGGERRAGRARARGARGGGQEERGRGEQHGDEAERPSHRAVESRQPAGRGEVAVAFRLPSRDSRLDGQTAGPAPLARRDVRAARARAGARGADLAGRRVARRRRGRRRRTSRRRDRQRRQLGRRVGREHRDRRRGSRRLPAPRRAVGRAGEPRRRAQHAVGAAARRRAAERRVRRDLARQQRGHLAPLGAPPGGRRLERRRHDRPAAPVVASTRCWRARTGR